MRLACTAVLMLGLLAQSALAQDNGALPVGGTAGVARAQKGPSSFYTTSVGAALLGLGALMISSQYGTTGTIYFDSKNDTVIPVNNTVISTSTTGGTH